MPEPTRLQLISFIRERFDPAELEDLCLQLDVKYSELKGNTLGEKTRELVLYMERRGSLPVLREVLERERSELYHAAFDEAVIDTLQTDPDPTVPAAHPNAGKWKGVSVEARTIGVLVLIMLGAWAVTNSLVKKGVNFLAETPLGPTEIGEVRVCPELCVNTILN